ncbi:hypothetical protein K1719_044791 [Acacia pycnantha]|nr:hypothetical protein K1719_044791 [Acacia pycnantha]
MPSRPETASLKISSLIITSTLHWDPDKSEYSSPNKASSFTCFHGLLFSDTALCDVMFELLNFELLLVSFRRLQLYILDIWKRRGMDTTAEIFQKESDVIDAFVERAKEVIIGIK